MLLTRKASTQAAPQSRLARAATGALAKTMDRRTFLKRSGVGVGAGAVASQLPFSMIGAAEAKADDGKIEVKRTICTHCSVGCAIDAVVQNGVWIPRSRYSIRRSTSARTAPRAPRCASTASRTIRTASSTR